MTTKDIIAAIAFWAFLCGCLFMHDYMQPYQTCVRALVNDQHPMSESDANLTCAKLMGENIR